MNSITDLAVAAFVGLGDLIQPLAVHIGSRGPSGDLGPAPREGLLGAAFAIDALSLDQTFLNPVFYLAVTAILTLERILPVDSGQRSFHSALCQDLAWLIVEGVLKTVVVISWITLVTQAIEVPLGGGTTWPFERLRPEARFVAGILFVDLVGWLQHWIRHRGFLWNFHAVHHSQRMMNMFSDARIHIVDWTIGATITTSILSIVHCDAEAAISQSIVLMWFTRAYHARIRTNFGILGIVVVSPQFHRIHHSRNPLHHGSNYGVLFTIWDRIFGTCYHGRDEYPSTGISDPTFPHGSDASVLAIPGAILTQMLHPFLATWRDIRKAIRTSRGKA